jgi:hypothetical protein
MCSTKFLELTTFEYRVNILFYKTTQFYFISIKHVKNKILFYCTPVMVKINFISF